MRGLREAPQHLLDLDGNPVAVDNDGALGDGKIVGENTNLVILHRVEFDDRATTEAENLMNRHRSRPEHDRDIESDLFECCHDSYSLMFFPNLTMGWLPGG
jgi:hypothetical protein